MKRLQMPENKIARLVINVVFIFVWYVIAEIYPEVSGFATWTFSNGWEFMGSLPHYILHLAPMCLVTRYIWFKKSRNRIFFGFFDKFKKYQPRIYTTSSNADELKKYAELKDQGVISEEEFQAKKKQLLGL